MEIFHWKEYWNRLKGSLRKVHPELTDQDLNYEEGSESELIERLSLKLRKSSAELNEVLFIHLIAVLDELDDEESQQSPETRGIDPETLLEELEKEMQEPPPSTGHRY